MCKSPRVVTELSVVLAALRYRNSDFSDNVERAMVSLQIALLNKSWHIVKYTVQVLKNLSPIVHTLQNVLCNLWLKLLLFGGEILKKWPVLKLVATCPCDQLF